MSGAELLSYIFSLDGNRLSSLGVVSSLIGGFSKFKTKYLKVGDRCRSCGVVNGDVDVCACAIAAERKRMVQCPFETEITSSSRSLSRRLGLSKISTWRRVESAETVPVQMRHSISY
jgi:hypothetical protein